MAPNSILALDVGTFSARALLLDAGGEALATAARPLALTDRGGGCVEQDPAALLAACRAVLGEALAGGGRAPDCCGIAVQRSSVLAWHRRSGAPLSPVLSWQDTRSADRLASLAEHEDEIARISGLRLSPHYGAGKLAWLLAAQPAVAAARREECLALGPLAAWLLASLRDDEALEVDHANASRTLLWNLAARDWDPRLLELFGLEAELLPRSRPLRHDYGVLAGHGIPIRALSGDQNAAVLAGGAPDPAAALVNLGTGAFLLRPVGAAPRAVPRLLAGILDSDSDGASYLVEGTVNGAGAAFAWAEARWGLSPLAPRLDDLPADVEPAPFLNAVGGLGSPWWRHDVETAFAPAAALPPAGAAPSAAQEASIALGVAESVLFLIQSNLDALRAAGLGPERLVVTGGLARSRRLCQGLADLAELPLALPAAVEATARGAAWLAAGGPPGWRRAPAIRVPPTPNAALHRRYESWLASMRDLA